MYPESSDSVYNVNYYIRKIETGYQLTYYLNGREFIFAFEDFKDVLNFLKDNPPGNFKKELVEVE